MIPRLLEWFVSSPPATTITAVAALIAASRWLSSREHRTTLNTLKGVGEQINGGLIARIERIEKKLERLGILTDDDGGQGE